MQAYPLPNILACIVTQAVAAVLDRPDEPISDAITVYFDSMDTIMEKPKLLGGAGAMLTTYAKKGEFEEFGKLLIMLLKLFVNRPSLLYRCARARVCVCVCVSLCFVSVPVHALHTHNDKAQFPLPVNKLTNHQCTTTRSSLMGLLSIC